MKNYISIYINNFLQFSGTSLHEIFRHANHRANRRDKQSRFEKTEAEAAAAGIAGGDHIHSVSHSELLSYTDYLYLCNVSFYFQHQQQQNVLSIYDCGQIFIQVKEGGGSSLHSGQLLLMNFTIIYD